MPEQPVLTPEQKQMSALMEEIVDGLAKGHTLKVVHGLDEKDMEAVYGLAHSLYQSGRYDKAKSAFKFLCLYDHTEPKWWIGLGATMQRLKDFEGAVKAYAYATLMDVENPKPQLHAGYCLMALQKYDEAKCALEGTIMACGEDPKKAEYKTQAEALLKVVAAKKGATGEGN